MDVNVNGSLNVLKSCKNCNISKFIVISSATVYGQGIEIKPHNENPPTNPILVYGKSKLEMENEVKEFSRISNLNLIIFRLFNVYGEGQSDVYTGVIKKFVNRARQNKPVIIYGKGDQTRDFIHVINVIEYIIRAIKNIRGKKGEIYNIGTEKIISIKQLVIDIFSIFEKNFVINYAESLEGDIKCISTKIDKSEKMLNYSSKIRLKDGIARTFF